MAGGTAARRWGQRLAVLAMMAASSPAPAAAAEASVIIVVDFQTVVRNSAAARSVQEQIDGMRRSYQEEFGAIEDELRTLEAELTEQRDGMSSEQFVQRRREFERRVTVAQREAQARRAALDRALEQAMDEIRNQLVEVVAEIADEQQANVVLNRSQIVLFDQSLEFSDEALARLDDVLPSVEVDAPDPR